MTFRARWKVEPLAQSSGTVYRTCHACGKGRPEANMVKSKDGKRWYCNDRERKRGERAQGGAK